MKKALKKTSLILILAGIFTFTANAELITSQKFGYTVDFPEGFEISDMEEDESTVIFKHKILDVEALVKVWPEKSYQDAKKAMDDTMKKLDASSDTTEAIWRNRKCAVNSFSSKKLSPNTACSGWGVSIPLTEKKGWLVFLTYAPEKIARDCEQFMISILDSVLIDSGCLKEPGIITSAFFPRTKAKEIELAIGEKKIKTQIDEIDSEASQFVLEREFEVFKLYAALNSDLAIPAWQRFYRTIAKDSLGRLKRVSFDIRSELQNDAEKKDSKTPDAALAQMLLTWTQTFKYERVSSSSDKVDFTNLIDVLEKKPSDCDSRSMLLAVLTKNMGMDSIFFISSEYSHAMFGINLKDKLGQSIKVDGKEYLVGETTQKDITLGKIPANMQDRTKWIPVEFMY